MNGDGRDDLLAGAPRADTGRTDGGAGYVLLGFGAPSFSYPATVEATARVASSAAAARPPSGAPARPTYSISPALPAGMTLDRRQRRDRGHADHADRPADHAHA